MVGNRFLVSCLLAAGAVMFSLPLAVRAQSRSVELSEDLKNQPLDIFLLQDLSSSFDDDLSNLRILVPKLVDELKSYQPDSQFGIGSFVDYPEYGGGRNDYPYRVDLKLTKNRNRFNVVLDKLKTEGGGDGPESQLRALLEVANDFDKIGFREDSLKIVFLATDASFHDSSDSPLYPSVEEVKQALREKGLIPVFLLSGSSGLNREYDEISAPLQGAIVGLEEDSSDLIEAITTGIDTVLEKAENAPFDVARRYIAPTTATALSNVGEYMAKRKQPELAVAYLKGAIEAYEQTRLNSNASQPTKEEIERTYRLLAGTLLQQDRTFEAQETLDAFTVWELAYYFDISAPRAQMRISQQSNSVLYAQTVQTKALSAKPSHAIKPTLDIEHNHIASGESEASPVTILKAERDILIAHNADQAGAMALGIELAKLLDIAPSQRSTVQKKRIAQLRALENDINRDFNTFIGRPNIQSRVNELSDSSQRQTVNPREFDPLRSKLKQLNAAVVYPLILEDRVELVITTSQTAPLRRTVTVERDEVVASIERFRSALTGKYDAMQRSQQLYNWLIKPIQADLEKAGVKSILYAPYGQLRYIPLAALHDGNQWLVEKYGVNTITALSLQDLTAERKPNPRILAAAFADTDTQYEVPLGKGKTTFRGLKAAKAEVELLTQERPNHTLLMDQDFSLQNTMPAMDDVDVLHFATHAAFIPGKPKDSFILFGNGEQITLADIAKWALPNLQMAVLSACQTGYGRVLDSGIEVLGLGYQFHKVGAHSVMASLWFVDDGATQPLMNAFYHNLDQGMTKNEALQAAQIAFLQSGGGQGKYSHPYYWSPFITIGNGL